MLLLLLSIAGCYSSDKDEPEEEFAETGTCSLCDDEPKFDFQNN